MRPGVVNNYGAETEDGKVYQASDADVAIIAHHATRLAADTVLTTDNSSYPNSMYLIGLAQAWVFEAPFTTIPIATNHLLRHEEDTEKTNAATNDDNAEFIVSLIKKLDAANPSA